MINLAVKYVSVYKFFIRLFVYMCYPKFYTSTVLASSLLIPSSDYHAFADHQERQVAVIDVDGNPRGIALDKRSNMMYVLYSDDVLAQIDPNNNRVIHRVPSWRWSSGRCFRC